MCVNAIKRVPLLSLLVGAVATGVGLAGQAPERQAGTPDLLQAAKPEVNIPKPGAGRMFVTGRVVDPQGKPVAGASLMVYARSMAVGMGSPSENLYPRELGRASSDESGRFGVDVPRTSS